MTSRARNHCSLPNRTSTRPDKYRKPPATAYIPQIPPPVKQEYAPADEPEYASDNDFKASGDPESEDSLSLGDANAAADANGDVDHQQYRTYADDAKREKLVKSVIYAANPKPKRTPAYVTEAYDDYAYQATTNVQRKPPDYGTKKVPVYEPTMPAHQKWQQLRELQHRRDFTDKYYAQEIRRLLEEQNNVEAKPVSRNTAGPAATLLPKARSGYVAERPATASAGFDDLEACGTMTTITRLDCGCVEQTTRPIFTTAAGRVQRRTCAKGQQVHMQLSTPSARLVNGHPRIRSKSFGEPRSNSAAAAVVGQEAAGAASRAASPVRKLSESSVNSM